MSKKMNSSDLLPHCYGLSPPWLVVAATTPEDEKFIPAVRYASPHGNPVIRVIRGRKMTTYDGLMTEFGAVFQFFDGFGENWDALSECLSYLDEWLPADAYITEAIGPQSILAEENEDQLKTFLRVLDRVGAWWATPITDNPPHNRPAVPFHVVFKCTPLELAATADRFQRCAPADGAVGVVAV